MRRHTIQFPSPAIFQHLPGDLQSSTAERRLIGENPQQLEGLMSQISLSAMEHEVEEEAINIPRNTQGIPRIPRQTTQPELGSWKPGLQREAPGNVVGEDDFHWLPFGSVSEATAKFNISDVKELSLDLGQEAANTKPPPRASPLPRDAEELTQPPRESPNLQINVTAGNPMVKIN